MLLFTEDYSFLNEERDCFGEKYSREEIYLSS